MPVSKCIFHSTHLVRLRYKFIAVRCSFLSLRRLHGLLADALLDDTYIIRNSR